VVSNTLHAPLDESAKLLLFRGFSSRLLGILPAWLVFQPTSRRHIVLGNARFGSFRLYEFGFVSHC